MPNYHRTLLPGGTFFFTVVTYHRQPILTCEQSRAILHSAWENVRFRMPFVTDAICLLPDHIHCIWTLPDGDSNYSLRWGEIKKLFTKAYRQYIGPGEKQNSSRVQRGEAAIWQRRFWEHAICNLEDLHRHLDYIHYNPVKHGLVKNVADWRWSSFQRYVRMGNYPSDWGATGEIKIDDGLFGDEK
jgi:putative transposase